MVRNESTWDRVLRLAVAVVAVAVALVVGAGSAGGIVLLVVGAVLLVTAAVGFCPLYRVLGLSTCPVPKGMADR